MLFLCLFIGGAPKTRATQSHLGHVRDQIFGSRCFEGHFPNEECKFEGWPKRASGIR